MSSTADQAVDVRDVTKIYRPGLLKRLFGNNAVHALAGVDLSVYRGEIFGLLGPNGAGKSTLVKILLGLVRPTRLSGSLLGGPVGRREAMARVGYLPEQHRFPPYLSGRQIVEFFSALSGIDRRDRRRRAAALLDRVGMTEAADRRVNTYSKGMRQRVGLAQALAAAPELIILDEPTDGVDPLARRDIRDVLIEQRNAGASVFVNSHLLSELELICDRVAILVAGRVAKQGTLDEMALGNERYEIELAQPMPPQRLGELLNLRWDHPPAAVSPRPASLLPATLGLGEEAVRLGYNAYTGELRLETLDLTPASRILDALRRADVLVRRFQPVRPSLEDVFLSVIAPPPHPDAHKPA